MDEAEQSRIEEKYFDDNDYFEELNIVEGELIDAYLGGQLSEEDNKDFELCFLQSPERKERVEFAKAWKSYVAREIQEDAKIAQPVAEKSYFAFLRRKPFMVVPIAAALLLLVGCIWLSFEVSKLKKQLEAVKTESQIVTQREQELTEQLQKERENNALLSKELDSIKQTTPQNPQTTPNQNPLSQIVSFVLNANAVRGSGGVNTCLIPATAETVRLIMNVKDVGYAKYFVMIKSLGGKDLLSQTPLTAKPQGEKLQFTWSLPAKSFDEGIYVVTLNGADETGKVEKIDDYAFRVKKN
jgi:hypothetical protein